MLTFKKLVKREENNSINKLITWQEKLKKSTSSHSQVQLGKEERVD